MFPPVGHEPEPVAGGRHLGGVDVGEHEGLHARREHWTTLLRARAIENQAYVVGCNRVGTAGDGTAHTGDSRIIDPMGEVLAGAAGTETLVIADVHAPEVAATRDRLRFLGDRR